MSSPQQHPHSPPDLSGLSIGGVGTRGNEQSFERDYDPQRQQQFFYNTAPSPYQALGAEQNQVNHTVTGGGRARVGLPSHWVDHQTGNHEGYSQTDSRSISSASPPPSQFSQSIISSATSNAPSTGAPADSEDDVIPTAIVIKNIPFSVKKETLLEIIASLSIPTPYAFNYHVDDAGQFRGLAFANFRVAQDAAAVVAALNGFDVQGRKLRVEYKKVLRAGEKERIERDKALKRIRSMQLDQARSSNNQWENTQDASQASWGAPSVEASWGTTTEPSWGGPTDQGPTNGVPAFGDGSERGFGNASLPPQSPHRTPRNLMATPSVPPVPTIPQYYQGKGRPPGAPSIPSPEPFNGGLRSLSPPANGHISPSMAQTRSQEAAGGLDAMAGAPSTPAPSSKSSTELDMNDASTLEIYSRILLFKDDRMRDELAFSRSLSTKERRVVHLVAQKLGVYHYSVGEGTERYAVVTRQPRADSGTRPPPSSRSASAAHTLSRAQSGYLSQSTNAHPSRSVSGSTSHSALRIKKSMPDMSSLHTPSHNTVSSSARLSSRTSSGNIREGYATISGSGRRSNPGFNGLFGGDESVPPVPTLPSNIDGYSTNQNSGAGVLRQPHGPSTGDTGFGLRRMPSSTSPMGLGNDVE